MAVTAFKDISLSELAKNRTGLGLVKSGVKKEKGEWVDPYTLDVATPTEISSEELGTWENGSPYIQLCLNIINANGTTTKAGAHRLNLPVEFEPGAFESAEDQAAAEQANQKAGEQFLRFLRAIAPEQYNVFASIDKSDPNKWVYLDYAGKTMSEKARQKRADEIDAAVMGVVAGVMDGSISFAGAQCYVTKKASNNPKRPFVNFSSADNVVPF